MASIASLPVELINAIAVDLEANNLLALRLTCKALNLRAWDSHLNAIYQTRTIYFVPASLHNLLKISRHPSEVNRRVHRVLISYTIPYEFRFIYQLPKAVSRLGFTSEHDRLALELGDFLNSGEDTNLLALAFSNLPNLRSIVLEQISTSGGQACARSFSRSELNLLFPSLGLKPGTSVPKGLDRITVTHVGTQWRGICTYARYDLGSGIWTKIMAAVAAAGLTSVTTIRYEVDIDEDEDEDEPGVWLKWFSRLSPQCLSSAQALFANLKVLSLTLNPGLEYIYSCANGAEVSRDICKFSHWLGVIGRRLESLRLGIVNGASPLALALPILPSLRSATIRSFNLETEDLKNFLGHCKRNLVELEIGDWETDSDEEDWFSLLQFIRREVTGLRKFAMDCRYLITQKATHCLLLTRFLVNGDWALGTTRCEVNVEIERPQPPWFTKYTVTKQIKRELEAHNDPDSFWSSVTGGGRQLAEHIVVSS
ncbi:hypothetical protein TWF281_002902 [Arthrobotrys megalospora]